MLLTTEQAVKILWSWKGFARDAKGPEHLYATTTRSVTFREWNGHYEEDTVYEKPSGTRVLVTMISRFGHVGIRARNLVPASHGYDACVQPEELTDWSTEP